MKELLNNFYMKKDTNTSKESPITTQTDGTHINVIVET